jgi:general stress protein CsbA
VKRSFFDSPSCTILAVILLLVGLLFFPLSLSGYKNGFIIFLCVVSLACAMSIFAQREDRKTRVCGHIKKHVERRKVGR